MKEMVRRFFTEESGQGMTEYALILALVSIVAIGALIVMGENIEGVFDSIKDSLSLGE
ncbi:Flp family type IVb pilin [Dethiobacter alkaliphilus]|uniref:Flp family type IVb pilin n=1 Tax=Dethiobacter alkaliphilus TaxID=427926 RepID=UPI002227174E|nr:Flp family type IVb pilin [Dethiobacter alkaliphilus]MCW3489627.1 Flp family type IVb pilin [Dethiobacter alkaliphilus]